MNYRRYLGYAFFLLVPSAGVLAISMVWNFRIAQITGQPITEGPLTKKRSAVVLVFDQYRKKYTGAFQQYIGALGSFIWNGEPWFGRIDGAFSHIKEIDNHRTTFSGTETDDILFTFGRGREINDRTRVALSLLFGVPTHKILRLKHPDFGYSLIGLGVQGDGSFAYQYTHSRGAFLYGMRYIHFFPGDAVDSAGCRHRFSIGEISDLLFAYKHAWKKHGFEFGTTLRWRYAAHISPFLADAVAKSNYARTNVYVVYKYKFVTEGVENRLLFYIAYGRDQHSKRFGNKYIVTLWTSWNGRF